VISERSLMQASRVSRNSFMQTNSSHPYEPHSTPSDGPTARLGHSAKVSVDERVVRVEGELDALTAPLLSRFLNTLPAPPEVVDCSRVTFIGAAGITALLDAADRHPFVTIASPVVNRLCSICNVSDTLRLRSGTSGPDSTS
jgi:anti-anti-sigma factor